MNVIPKFHIGDEVFFVAQLHEVRFDDGLPVVKVVVDKIRFEGFIVGGDLAECPDINFAYWAHEVDGLASQRCPAESLFKSEQEANEAARTMLASMKTNAQERIKKINSMLDGAQ